MAAISKELREMSQQPWFPIMMRELGYEPVKHGKWEIGERMPFGVNVFLVRCSECGKEAIDDGLEPIWRYCPKCGAIMDKV